MAHSNDFYDKPIYVIAEYLVAFILSNVYFLLCNIPFIIYAILVAIEPNAFSVFSLFLFLIPAGPAITALCSSMGKLFRDKDVIITSYYFNSYKEKFLQSLKIWSIVLLVMFISVLDFKFFVLDKGQIFGVVFLALMIYVFLISLYAFPLLSKFDLKLKQLVMLSLYSSIKKFPITILKTLFLCAMYYLSYKLPILCILGLFSLGAYVMMSFDNSLLLQLEELNK